MQAVLLVGGLGTRLGELVKDIPKPMMLINGKPFLQYLISFLAKNRMITEIILCTGYKHEVIANYFGNGLDFGTQIKYSIENERLDTGGALKNALHMLEDNFFVLNGDTYTIFEMDKLLKFHEKHNGCTIVTRISNDRSRFGNVLSDEDGLVKSFGEKKIGFGNLISCGVYLFRKEGIRWGSFSKKFSIEHDLFPSLINEKKLYSLTTDGYFCDIGTISDLERFRKEVMMFER